MDDISEERKTNKGNIRSRNRDKQEGSQNFSGAGWKLQELSHYQGNTAREGRAKHQQEERNIEQ